MSGRGAWRRALVALAALGLAAPGARAAELAGRVELVEGGRPAGGAEQAVVWFEPERAVPPPPAVDVAMTTHRKRFDPRVLVVPVGSIVRFPNRDPILHNVFSISGGNAFDLGLIGGGEGGSARFVEAGVVRVFCNVHHRMVGYVVVVDTPFSTAPAPDGAFRLSGLPAGPGELVVWHERGEPLRQRVDPASGPPPALRLELTRPLVPVHLNKLGRPYDPARDRY